MRSSQNRSPLFVTPLPLGKICCARSGNKKEHKIKQWGGGLPREGMGVEEFVPSRKFAPSLWRVPNPPGANPLVAERAPWRSLQSCVTGGQQPIGNPYRFLSFLLHTWQPLCDPNSHSRGRLFPLPGG